MKLAFVTGASGFIGTHLIRRLIHDGWKVRALVHKNPIQEFPGLKTIKGDIEDTSILLKGMAGADAVFHLAAALGSSVIPENEFVRINVSGTQALLKAAKAAKIPRVIHVSSAGVLGRVDSNRPADENAVLEPQNIYDLSKLEGEKQALRASEAGLDVVVIRPGWVYGPGDKRTFKLIRAIARNRFVLVSDGSVRQTPVEIRDLISGILLCFKKGKKGRVYHIAGSELLSVREIAVSIAEAAGTSVPGIKLPLFPVRILAWGMERLFSLFGREAPLTTGKLLFFTHPKPLDIEKARNELNFKPGISFKIGIAEAIAWYRDQGWL